MFQCPQWGDRQEVVKITKTPFLGRTHFCTTNLIIWYYLGQETYIHFVAQETRIIRKLSFFNFLKKVKIDNTKVVF